MNETERLLDNIFEFIYNQYMDDSVQLKIGIWDLDAVPYDFYAIIEDNKTLYFGESSYGSETLQGALRELNKELEDYYRTL